MTFQAFIFYSFSAVLIFAAIGVIVARNPVHAALFLVLAFFTSAGLWILLQAEFLAITLVLVYVGAVMVLFLFVVMMIDVNIAQLRKGFWSYLPLGATVALLLVAEMTTLILLHYAAGAPAAPAPPPADYSNVRELGRLIYTDYVYPFEIAAAILLVAIVVAIALTLRRRKVTKYVDPAQQVEVRREQRIRVVPMATEKREEQRRG
ncbi:MAG TPA: NADH-quinone oxidoreductase subunit J [Burkholderiales bacterium]|nr:NADH-quinone oxidoreductase subunit J [Burkholderiales bacterium]